MNILIVDGQGGRIGRLLAEGILARHPQVQLTAVGTNSIATAAMVKAGVREAATGENPVVVCARRADVILGPIGIVLADAMLGEITPKMAEAIASSPAERILIPMSRCHTAIAGAGDLPLGELIADALQRLDQLMNGGQTHA